MPGSPDLLLHSWLRPEAMLHFWLVLMRVTGLVISNPLLGNETTPAPVRVALCLLLSLMLAPWHPSPAASAATMPRDLWQLAILAIPELALGLLLGFVVNLMFSGIQAAGEVLSIQIGFTLSSVLDPITKQTVPVLGQFFFYFAFVVFLCLNLHHVLIAALHQSFIAVPLGGIWPSPALLLDRILILSGQVFTLALMAASPVLGLMLVVEVALGFVARVMPQLNVFVVGLPFKIVVGLLGLLGAAPMLAESLQQLLAGLARQWLGLYGR
jgi:flagellar biosynthetic protein FliR